MIDLKTCPLCHESPYRIASLDRIEAVCVIDFWTENGITVGHPCGDTEVLWDTTEAIGYICRECGSELPEEYQDAIEQYVSPS